MKRPLTVFAALFAPLVAPHGADVPKPPVKVTQELLNSIHVTPKLIFDPIPAYAQKFLPFAMAASMESTSKGRLWMLSRGMKEAFQSFSTDGGKTWEPQSTAFQHASSRCSLRRLQSGAILLIKHGTAISVQKRDDSDWGKQRSRLTAFLSMDDGKTWPASLLLDERASVSYPDIAQAPNGDIYVHYDRDRNGAAEILFARFREEDVQAGKLVSQDGALKNLVKSRQLGMNRGGPDGATSAREPR